MQTILVPVDGASNIKLEALDFDTLETVHSVSAETPVTEHGGLACNETGAEFAWFDRMIGELPDGCRDVRAIAPAARGASGGLIGADNTLTEAPGRGLTLAYTQDYPERVHERFAELAGDPAEFFRETGSVRDFPGSLTLLKRFVYEEMERPEILDRSARFATYGILMAGHFLGDFLAAAEHAGNEHGYWMAHSGARNVRAEPGTPSAAAGKVESFRRLVPADPATVYRAIGTMPAARREVLGVGGDCMVVPGGHDTCLSHIPVMSSFYQAFPDRSGSPVIHLDAGSWTMVALVGGKADLPGDGYKRHIIVQGTVDGDPVVTAIYGGGNDFREVKCRFGDREDDFRAPVDERLLAEAAKLDCHVLPNIHPMNRCTGPFPELEGCITDEQTFFADPARAYLLTNLTTAIVTAVQIETVAPGAGTPIVLTAGGSRDPWFGRLVASITRKPVYKLSDRNGRPLSETTTLGAAIAGKAACLGIHPYEVDVSPLGVCYDECPPFGDELTCDIMRYRARLLERIAGG